MPGSLHRSQFPLRFGGKISPTSGQLVDALVTVAALQRGCWQSSGPTQVPLRAGAAVRIAGIENALISHRTQALGWSCSAISVSSQRSVSSWLSGQPTASWRRSDPWHAK